MLRWWHGYDDQVSAVLVVVDVVGALVVVDVAGAVLTVKEVGVVVAAKGRHSGGSAATVQVVDGQGARCCAALVDDVVVAVEVDGVVLAVEVVGTVTA